MPRGRNGVMGEQLAQVDNRDPFAAPVWRSPVYRTPEPVIFVVQLDPADLAGAVVRPHPSRWWMPWPRWSWSTWLGLSWPGVAGLARWPLSGLAGLRVIQPEWFARFVAVPVRDWWRWWFYRRRWKAAMTLAGLAPDYRGQPMLPGARPGAPGRGGGPGAGRPGDRAGPGRLRRHESRTWRTRSARGCAGSATLAPGVLVLELVRADTLADPIPALPITGEVDLAGLPVGRCEDGSPWRLRLAATHVLIAGATGSGKGSVIWSLIRALLPAIAAGWVQVWALDPKRMELSFGRALFHRYACQATAMVELLEAAVAEMHDRAEQFGGRTRTFTPSTGFPFLVILVDELAFLTAYQPERDLRKRAEAAIATLTSQGRSVGVCVVGALQDPRKDVISLRNLFSTRIALRLDESDQVDMVLGDGARDRGALADQISPLPWTGAGVGYVRLEASPTRYGSAPPTSPTTTSARWPRPSATCRAVAYEGDRVAD